MVEIPWRFEPSRPHSSSKLYELAIERLRRTRKCVGYVQRSDVNNHLPQRIAQSPSIQCVRFKQRTAEHTIATVQNRHRTKSPPYKIATVQNRNRTKSQPYNISTVWRTVVTANGGYDYLRLRQLRRTTFELLSSFSSSEPQFAKNKSTGNSLRPL